MTSKQRAYLRSLANPLPALYQIGKGGISDNFIKQMNDALEAKELIKVSVLENSMLDTRDICQQVAVLARAEPVQVIGSKFVLYRQSIDHKTIELPK